MPYIQDEIKQEILDRTDIVDLISSYFPLQSAGRNKKACCPFHSEDTPSFIVSPDRQTYHCFGCQKGGNAISFVMEYEHLSFPEAMEKLANRCGVTLPKKELNTYQKKTLNKKRQIMDINEAAMIWFKNNRLHSAEAQEYMRERHISGEIADTFMLGYAPESWNGLLNHLKGKGFKEPDLYEAGIISKKESNGRCYDMFRNRLMFPVCDKTGKIVAFSGRALDDSPAKYVNSPETPAYHKSDNLYGLFQALNTIRQTDKAILLEGNVDVVTAHQYGITNAVAPLGTAFTKEQAKVLHRYCSEITIVFDGDAAGQKAIHRGLDILAEENVRCYAVILPDNSDPDEFLKTNGRDEWDKLIDNRLTFMDFKLRKALKDFDVSTAEGKGFIAEALLPSLLLISNSVEQNAWVNKLAELLEVPPEELIKGFKGKTGGENRGEGSSMSFAISSKSSGIERARKCVLFYAAESKDMYQQIKDVCQWSFLETPVEKLIHSTIENHIDEYNWNLRDLPELADTEEQNLLREFIMTDPFESGQQWNAKPDKDKIFMDCWKTIRREQLEKELNLIQKSIRESEDNNQTEDIANLLRKFSRIKQELRKI